MQPSGYGAAEIHQFIDNDSSSSLFNNISNPPPPPQHHHSFYHLLQNHKPPQHLQVFSPPPPQHSRQLFHHQTRPTTTRSDPSLDMSFKLALDANNTPTAFLMPQFWHSQEDSSIKQRFWCNNNNNNNNNTKRSEEEKRQETEGNNPENNDKCKLFNELEAIYNHTGSGSALTGENLCKNVVNNAIGVDHGSENSIGEEAVTIRKKKKRKCKEKLETKTMVGFFETLVKQVIDHQESLHRKFLEAIEKMDRERSQREESWRREQSDKYNREAIARANEQKLVSDRDNLIIAHVEKITGRNINLPPRIDPNLTQEHENVNNKRWPKAEVEALIQVRSGLESRFVEAGSVKGPLWEEVSVLMGLMGYQTSARRCKDKWENMNKYFKRTKESGKKRTFNSKTCAYFDQLDQLYSTNNTTTPSCSSFSSGDVGVQSGEEDRIYIGERD